MPRKKAADPPGPRLGRQTPTRAYILPYETTRGAEAVALYAKTGRTAQEWQQLLLYDILAVNAEGLWVHTRFGYSVPRRNGKNEIVAMVEMSALNDGRKCLHTAHRTTTSHSAWERLCGLLDDAGIGYTSVRATGRERIKCRETGGVIEFRTRSTKGGLGEGFDLLVIDEAQEYTEDQESALKYVVSDSANPQTLLCGTPPTPTSSGTVFMKMRAATLAGERTNTGWAEWGVAAQHDPQDRDAWYETNPSMGTILTERKVLDEIGPDVIDFNIQRLGLWLRYNQKSAISRAEWDALKVETLPALTGKLFVGIKYARNGSTTAMSIAVHTADERIFVEAIDCRPRRSGNAWILSFLDKACAEQIVVDGANGQQLLETDLKERRIKPKPLLPTVRQVIAAHAAFEQMLYARTLCHMGQPSLTQSVSNCEKRAIGTGGGFGYRTLREEVEVSLIESAVLAAWACAEGKERRPQKIGY